ncbi:MAG: low molecular weight phosphotyrosine protein phosphatase [Coleofasciculaceae cyanobacterium SM2_1_6]|nr:low molecular weight phosphotyrosine protein phosphatase [Coleofasciculaceae cyanobacterium SM2_1_6]
MRLLFVCLGNICRSPAAENIMNHLIQEAGLEGQITCDSAGTAGYHTGAAPDRRMAIAAQKQGITLEGRARQFQPEDLAKFDLVLAMDEDNYRDILRSVGLTTSHPKVKMMCSYAQNHPDREVPDPYYGGSQGFDYVIELLMDACQGLLQEIKTEIPEIS